jgi:predicted house-cleaning noncanonical NTP pyrophosphatase (MazG superfamily)
VVSKNGSVTKNAEDWPSWHLIAAGLIALTGNAPPATRHALVKDIGRKAAGLAILPAAWTPPFVVIQTAVYRAWLGAGSPDDLAVVNVVSEHAAVAASAWLAEWPKGIAVRSSATSETLRERGTHQSTELTADYDGAMIARAVVDIFRRFAASGATGNMAIIVQARVANAELGHISNERRVSKTINQWMWEHEPANEQAGRFNSQRDARPRADIPLAIQGAKSLAARFRSVGRWCTLLRAGRTHLEWGQADGVLWLFQLDFEDDQLDVGVDPNKFLREADFTPSGRLPSHSPFTVAEFDKETGWSKIDNIAIFLGNASSSYPTLIYISLPTFLAAQGAGRDLAADLEAFAHGRVVCRTACKAADTTPLNLPRTDSNTSAQAVNFMEQTGSDLVAEGVASEDICFILHKFIPARAAAWAVARPAEQIVRVDTLWGLPDGLSYLPHDSFEFDVKRGALSSERLRYKHAFLQEAATGRWEVVKVARRSTRFRSLSSPDVSDVARRTHEIATRAKTDVQVMWFCDIPPEAGIGRNIPWFKMAPAAHSHTLRSVAPGKRRIVVRSQSDLQPTDDWEKGRHVLRIDPDEPELFRSTEFLDTIQRVATEYEFAVALTGSILAHAFYILERAGVTVIASDEPTRPRSRKLQRFGKMVRDDLPEQISEGGESVTLAHIAKGETRAALAVKLLEETYELLAADTPREVTAELADMLEVIRSLAIATGVDWSQVNVVADEKRAARGGFERNVVLLETSWPGWLEKPKATEPNTVPLAALGRITVTGEKHNIPYPRLLGALDNRIKLENGRELEVTMSAHGVQIEDVTDKPTTTGQFSFDL